MNIKIINSIPNILPGATCWDNDKSIDILIASLIADHFYHTEEIGKIQDVEQFYVKTANGFVAVIGYFLGKPAILHKLDNSDYRELNVLEFIQ